MPQAPNACLQAPCMDPMALLILFCVRPYLVVSKPPKTRLQSCSNTCKMRTWKWREPGKQRPGIGVPTVSRPPLTPLSLGESLCFDTAPAVSGASLGTGSITALPCTPGKLHSRPFSWARFPPALSSGVSLPVERAERQEEEKGTWGWLVRGPERRLLGRRGEGRGADGLGQPIPTPPPAQCRDRTGGGVGGGHKGGGTVSRCPSVSQEHGELQKLTTRSKVLLRAPLSSIDQDLKCDASSEECSVISGGAHAVAREASSGAGGLKRRAIKETTGSEL